MSTRQDVQEPSCTLSEWIRLADKLHKADAADIGERIRLKRGVAGFTQARLAVMSGYAGQTTITHIEVGRQKPNLENILRLAHALGCAPGELIR